MFDTVRARPGIPLGVLLTLLTRLPARSVALVVPGRQASEMLLREGAIEMIAARARQEGKDVAVVGGTVVLRARAVLAGLMAATSVEDWRVACRAQETDQPLWPAPTTGRPQLRVLAPAVESDVESQEVEPPAYLRAVLPKVTAPELPDITLFATDRESSSARIAREVERYEEDIAERILATTEGSCETLAEGAGASSPRIARSPWTHPLGGCADESEGGARLF